LSLLLCLKVNIPTVSGSVFTADKLGAIIVGENVLHFLEKVNNKHYIGG